VGSFHFLEVRRPTTFVSFVLTFVSFLLNITAPNQFQMKKVYTTKSRSCQGLGFWYRECLHQRSFENLKILNLKF
jgi:hypothetical protein